MSIEILTVFRNARRRVVRARSTVPSAFSALLLRPRKAARAIGKKWRFVFRNKQAPWLAASSPAYKLPVVDARLLLRREHVN